MTHCESFLAASGVDVRWKENIFIGLPPVPSQTVIQAGNPITSTIAATLLIPNGLLYKWHQAKSRPHDLVNKVNAHIIGGCLALDIQGQRLRDNLKSLVDKVGGKAAAMKKESERTRYLTCHTIMTIDQNEIIHVLNLKSIRSNVGRGARNLEENGEVLFSVKKEKGVAAMTQTDFEGLPMSDTLKEMYKELAQAEKREKMLRKKNKALELEITKLKQQLKNYKDPSSCVDPVEMALEILRGRDAIHEIGPQTKPMKLKKIKSMISENTVFLSSYGLELRKVEFATVPAGNYLAMNWEEGESARIVQEKLERCEVERLNPDNKATPNRGIGVTPMKSKTKEVEEVEELKAGEVQMKDLGKAVDFGFSATSKFDSLNEDKKQQVFELLNILDKYGITGECYHDLVMTEVGKLLPKSYLLKQAYTDLNERFKIRVTQGPNSGAQQSMREVLSAEIKEYINENPTAQKVQVKMVGYGTPISRSTHIVLLGFTLIDRVRNMISSASGFRTVSGYNGPESYQNIQQEFENVITDVNNLIKSGRIFVDGKEIALEFFLSGDYKFLTSVLGLKMSDSYCLYCKMSKDHRSDASKPRTHYVVPARKRTLEEAKNLPKTNKFGSKNVPLFNIEFDHVIVDDYCILNQVMDILIDNVINDCISMDEESTESDSEEHSKKLVDAIHKAGVPFFQIWKANDKWQWTTPLAATQKRILLEKLPEKLSKVLRPKTGTKVAKLWKDFKWIMDGLSQENITGEDIFNRAQKWLQEFVALGKNNKLEGYDAERVTMYMHMLPYHLPAFKDSYKNLRPYSGHGVEVSNNSVKMSFFRRGNRTNPLIDMMQWENRQWLTEVLTGRKKLMLKREAATAFGSPFIPPKRPRVVMHPSDVLKIKKSDDAKMEGEITEQQMMEELSEPNAASTPAEPQPGPSRPRQPIRPQVKQQGMRAVIIPSSAGKKPWIKVDNTEDNDAKKVKLFKELGAPDSDDEAPLQASSEVTEFSSFSEKEEVQTGPVVEAMNAVLFPSESNVMDQDDGEEMVVAPPTAVSQVSLMAEEQLEPPTLVPQDVPPIEIIPQKAQVVEEAPSEPPQMEIHTVVEQPPQESESAGASVTIETHVPVADNFVKEEDQQEDGEEEDVDDKSPKGKSIDPKAVVTGLKKRFAKK